MFDSGPTSDGSQQNAAAAPMGGLVGGVIGVSTGLALHYLTDDRDPSFEAWLLGFPHEFGADLWAAGGALVGATLAHLLGWLRRARRSAGGR